MSAATRLKMIGYWKDEGFDKCPRPQELVRPDWHPPEERARIASYLRNGYICSSYLGWADCRFEGCGEILGTCDRTDGEWIWPDRLEHYVLRHDVALPTTLIESMKARGWRMPTEGEIKATLASSLFDQEGGDLSVWERWGAEAAAMPPH